MAPIVMNDSNSNTLSTESEPTPHPPIYPRAQGKSPATQAKVMKWVEDVQDRKDDPMEVGPDSPVYSDTSPAAPIDRPAYHLLPTRRPIPPLPKTAPRDAVQDRRLPSGSVLDDNSLPTIIPVEGTRALNKRTSRLSPLLPHDGPEITAPPETGIQIKLDEWLDVEKLRADGHMGEIIIDVAEVTPEEIGRAHV